VDAHAILDAVQGVTKDWCRQQKREERAASARVNRHAALMKTHRVTLKDAVFAVMAAAVAQASGGGRVVFPKRNLYYSVRKLIQEHTAEELDWKYFEGALLRQWEAEHGQIGGMYCDPRGYFIEPHTAKVVPLGTREVEAYQIPAWHYDKIVYVEKKGFHGLFQEARLAERYDLGIMCAEGYSSEAGKLLLARAEQAQEMTIACFHDADPYGYNIARKLGGATRAGQRVHVIDAGLRLREALDMGLEPETFYRDRALPQGLELDDLERDHFEGEWTGEWRGRRKVYRCRRVELNDLASDPDRFVAWVEGKLREHGCARKLVPPRKEVLVQAALWRDTTLQSAAKAELARLLGLDGMVQDLVRALSQDCPIKDLPG
jgi:hypothetical protein